MPLELRDLAGYLVGNRIGDCPNMCRGRAATAANNIDQPCRCEFLQQARHVLRALVILAEFIRQTGIGIGTDQRVGDPPEFVDMRTHFLCTQGAVETDG